MDRRIVFLLTFSTLLVSFLSANIGANTFVKAEVYSQEYADTVVLINSASPSASDFTNFIKPYLDYFGIPYSTLDISKEQVPSDLGKHSLVIIGHKNLDPNYTYLTASQEEYIKAAVSNGAGLVNFDSFLFKEDTPPVNTSEKIVVNCWEDAHQQPVLNTFTNPALLNLRDNLWDEFEWSQRGYPGVFGGPRETLPIMRFYAAVPNGNYRMRANLYHTGSASNVLRYYYGFQPSNPREKYVDVGSGSDFAVYDLGLINVTNSMFEVYVDHADLLSGPEYFFGWAWIELATEAQPSGGNVPIYEYAKDIFNFTRKGTVNVQSVEIRNPEVKPPANDTVWSAYSNELLTNPGAEQGTMGWIPTGPNQLEFAAGLKPPSGYIGPHTGSNAFYWNLSSSQGDWAYQDIDLTPWQAWIRNGTAQVSFSAWLACSEYGSPTGDTDIIVNCWENEHQQPVLNTFANPALLNLRDNLWDEFEWSQRGYPGVFGGPRETLPIMRFYAAVPNGTYKMKANLYHTNSAPNVLRYYYGSQPSNPREKYLDVSSGSDFAEYDLGQVNVTNDTFEVYVDHADLLSGPEYFFGWASIRLTPIYNPVKDIARTKLQFIDGSGREIPAYDSGEQGLLTAWKRFGVTDYTVPVDASKARVMFQTYENNSDAGSADDFSLGIRVGDMPILPQQVNETYITSLHSDGEVIPLETPITVPSLEVSDNSQILATMNQNPFLITKNYGQGKAVQWTSYEFLDWRVLGYFKGLDDIFWRSLVWAARKPFVMQGMLPFVTMRIDDANGPYSYIDQTNGFIPVIAAFMNSGDKNNLARYVNGGKAICAIHERTVNDWGNIDTEAEAQAYWTQFDAFFYNGGDSFPMAKSWHAHFYETGVALAPGMRDRGVEFRGDELDFGMSFGQQFDWKVGPYTLYQHPSTNPSYIIADWSKPPFQDFFNVLSSPYPYYSQRDPDWILGGGKTVQGVTSEAVMRIKRSLDSMTFGCFFTHEENIEAMGYQNFGAATANIASAIARYNPVYADFDTIARYVRAVVGTSDISSVAHDIASNTISVTLIGKADVETKFYLFTENGGRINSALVNVPSFLNTVTVSQGL
jgi:hypothetical protein